MVFFQEDRDVGQVEVERLKTSPKAAIPKVETSENYLDGLHKRYLIWNYFWFYIFLGNYFPWRPMAVMQSFHP